MPGKIRVLVVDDSSIMREALRNILNSDEGIEVVGTACDGKSAVEKNMELNPDVITMDVSMPVMDGIEATQLIMEQRPVPIIIVSTISVDVIIEALGHGAMDFVLVTKDVDVLSKELIEKVKIARRVRALRRIKANNNVSKACRTGGSSFKKIVIGVSTGGPQALAALLTGLPKDINACILIVQHISEGFIGGLAAWLSGVTCLNIKVAESGEMMRPGNIYLAPDSNNMLAEPGGRIVLLPSVDKKALHVPSCDELLISAARSFGRDVVALIMTGMGHDGVEGMKAVRDHGGATIAQDERTSVIYGMNKIAVEKGYIHHVLPLERIAEKLVELTK